MASRADFTSKVWEPYRQPILNFIRSKVRLEDDSYDIFQEVMEKAFTHLQTVKNDSKIESWLFQISRNTITDYFRKKRPSELHPEFEHAEEKPQNMNDELAPCISSVVDHLPKKYKAALLATDLGGLSQKEYANQLGISHSGAKSQVQRARAQIKQMATDCCEIEHDRFGNILDVSHRGGACVFC